MPVLRDDLHDERLMAAAIDLALKAEYQTEPNPMVGAVLASAEGEILATGYHHYAGGPHAEVNALSSFDKVPPDSTLYVTLEPCNHQGKTGACTDFLLSKQVKNLVIGTLDPNPQMCGKSVILLQSAGVQVKSGVLEDRCVAINRVFNKHITTKMPYITLKAAITLDGKIATASGESQWITGPKARAFGQQLRSEHQAIGIGRGTLLADNPRLTNRNPGGHRQPDQVLFSSTLDFADHYHFFKPKTQACFVVTGSKALSSQLKKLEKAGVTLLVSKEAQPSVQWSLEQLYEQGVTSLLIEGGARLAASFLKENMIDRICLFISPRIMAQADAPSFIGGIGARPLGDIADFVFGCTRQLGKDILLEAFFRESDVYRAD